MFSFYNTSNWRHFLKSNLNKYQHSYIVITLYTLSIIKTWRQWEKYYLSFSILYKYRKYKYKCFSQRIKLQILPDSSTLGPRWGLREISCKAKAPTRFRSLAPWFIWIHLSAANHLQTNFIFSRSWRTRTTTTLLFTSCCWTNWRSRKCQAETGRDEGRAR